MSSDNHTPKPTVRPTRPATLFVAGLTAAALSWLAVSRYYSAFPDVSWLPGLLFVGLAGLEVAAAVNTKARIDRREGSQPVDPLLVARYVVLAKASALAGAIFVGFYGGIATYFLTEPQNAAARADLPPALIGLVGSLALLVGGLLLERACRVPPPPPSSDPSAPGWAAQAESDAQEADS
jgi:apolipoprotein N-acyltransferase